MTKLTTLYNLLKQWQQELDEMEKLQERLPELVNPQAIEVMEKMIESTRQEYINRGGRRPV